MNRLQNKRVAILLHGGIRSSRGKTGVAFLRYSEAEVVAVIDSETAGGSLAQLTKVNRHAPIVDSVKSALTYQPDVLLIGIAPSGGVLPVEWLEEVSEAVAAGLSIVNGLHDKIAPQFSNLLPSQWIWDIRQEPPGLGIGSGRARRLNCRRVLTVGTDMAVGKMSTSLELYRCALSQGIQAKFIATGQGGIMIAGDGIPLDAVRVDFAAGAVESMVLEAEPSELVVVEGQGSLLHPGSTATLPLIRGSQPTDLVLVHRAGQTEIKHLPDWPIPPLERVIELYETVANYANGTAIKVKAVALNTLALDSTEALAAIEQVESDTGLPCTDVVRYGAASLLGAII